MNKRKLGQEILSGLKDIKAGKGKRYKVDAVPDATSIRKKLGLSQSAFAGFLGVSVRTLQDWEQGRRQPSGPALQLLRVAQTHPQALLK
ncbi:MAG: transcriptional regulator [Nitrospinae bacterium CG11_big_fil_rev_8_21_14_0_20_56_8]|nr:MAG: transcriptional regulator [Nitrospinae bacterium CG11_big_fil_rev_8_21_14_0_20_56_8]